MSDPHRNAIEDGFAAWAKRHGFKRKTLSANRASDAGVQVIALEKSNFSASFYLRHGIKLQSERRFVQEPECDIRTPCRAHGARNPAVEAESEPAADDVVRLLDVYALPLLEQTRTRARLEELRKTGGLADALVLRDAQKDLGWEDQ